MSVIGLSWGETFSKLLTYQTDINITNITKIHLQYLWQYLWQLFRGCPTFSFSVIETSVITSILPMPNIHFLTPNWFGNILCISVGLEFKSLCLERKMVCRLQVVSLGFSVLILHYSLCGTIKQNEKVHLLQKILLRWPIPVVFIIYLS